MKKRLMFFFLSLFVLFSSNFLCYGYGHTICNSMRKETIQNADSNGWKCSVLLVSFVSLSIFNFIFFFFHFWVSIAYFREKISLKSSETERNERKKKSMCNRRMNTHSRIMDHGIMDLGMSEYQQTIKMSTEQTTRITFSCNAHTTKTDSRN